MIWRKKMDNFTKLIAVERISEIENMSDQGRIQLLNFIGEASDHQIINAENLLI